MAEKKKKNIPKIQTLKTSKEARAYRDWLEKRIANYQGIKEQCEKLIVELEQKEKYQQEIGKRVFEKLGENIDADTLDTLLELINEQLDTVSDSVSDTNTSEDESDDSEQNDEESSIYNEPKNKSA